MIGERAFSGPQFTVLSKRGPPQSRPSALWGEEEQGSVRSFPRRGKRSRADFAIQGGPRKAALRLCGERRSKGACGAFPEGGSGAERTLLYKGAPAKPPFGFVGRGGARERAQLSPQGEAEQSGLCYTRGPPQSRPSALWGEEEQGSARSFPRRGKRSRADFAKQGTPAKPSFGFVGRGGARERTQFSPQAETE